MLGCVLCDTVLSAWNYLLSFNATASMSKLWRRFRLTCVSLSHFYHATWTQTQDLALLSANFDDTDRSIT